MRIISTALLFSALATCLSANALVKADLSLSPFEGCRKPLQSPSRAVLHRSKDNVDINGDGWCDWVGMGAGAPHRGSVDEPQMADFIFLGISKGWRKFGVIKQVRSDRSQTGWLSPYVPVLNFIYATIVYSKSSRLPYFVVLGPNEDTAPSSLTDLAVLQWDANFDMAKSVDDQERQTILEFIRDKVCESGKNHFSHQSIAYVVCDTGNYPPP